MIALDRLDDMVTSLQFDKSQVSAWRASLETLLRSVHPCPPALTEGARLALKEPGDREAASVLECLYRQVSESESCKYSQS